MARTINDSHITEADVESLMDSIVAQNPHLNSRIEEVRNENNALLCEVLRIYPYDDTAYVRILDDGRKIYCKLSHEVLGNGMCIDYLPSGADKKDDDGKKYIEPYDELFAIVLKVRWKNLSNENVLLGYVNIYGHDTLKSSNDVGEISIKSGSSQVSVTNERVNIMSPSLFINGLPFDEPELLNYYDKKETDLIIDSIDNSELIYNGLLEAVENYKLMSDDTYTLFRGDCWTINTNYESSAAITSTSKNDFKVNGTFRTNQDMIGIYWYSKDLITHPYISYGSRVDYSDVIFEADVEFNNCLFDTKTDTFKSTFTIKMNDGSTYHIITKDYIDYSNNKKHLKIDFNNIIVTKGSEYLDENGNTITVEDSFKLNVTDIEYLMLVLIPSSYSENNVEYTIRENIDFEFKLSNIQVTGGYISNEHLPLPPHQYRLCEGYDDFYNLNPFRVCKEMRKLGYNEWVDLYIGASHFYEKKGTVNDKINVKNFNHVRTEKMVLDKDTPLNKAFISWLDCYSKELKNNGVDKIIISVSMENLQCPTSWRQKDGNGNYALTGWTPSTFFYSPCNEEVLPYMQSVSKACLDIIVNNGMQPILQLGEAWWWWNEYTDKVNRSPCFYDDKTKEKYKQEFGKDIPIYITPDEDFDENVIEWLNKQIVDYSSGLREIVKEYDDGLYLALFFPPSVLDEDRVPLMMRKVNYLTDIYSPKHIDILQLEDYDWVTGNPTQQDTIMRDREHHQEVYSLGEKLGFSNDKVHYFGGFVQYQKDEVDFWREIKKAMDDAIKKGFGEVYVWAGSQIRRDDKLIGHDVYELIQELLSTNCCNISTNCKNKDNTIIENVVTGWQVLNKQNYFWNITDNTKIEYKRSGNVVQIRGETELYENKNNSNELLIGVLPPGFRPPSDQYYVLEGKQKGNNQINYSWVCCVRTDGKIYCMHVMKNNENVIPSSGNQFNLGNNLVFMI